jgi:hypothetical protein
MDVSTLDVYTAFYFWGGQSDRIVLSSRLYFIKNATPNDRKAIAKLTDEQFNTLNWLPCTYSTFWRNL